MDEEREEYYIPANYNNSGRYLWGLTTGRNLLEMVVVLVPTVLLVYPLLAGLSLRARVIILLIIIFGLGAPLAIGIDGGSVGQYLYRIITFLITNKKYSMERINMPEKKAPEEPEEASEKDKEEPEKPEKKSLKDRMIEKTISMLEASRSKNNEKKESK